MKVCVVGCCHGKLDKIYNLIEQKEKNENIKVELLLICGDFQAIRNEKDLNTMAVSKKYRDIGDFHKYYSGENQAPILTIFIGGNHESSAFMQELPYGGWVAKNIFYMGYANVINIRGCRIAGWSGIYKIWDFQKGHYERPPYSQNELRSCYHVRQIEWTRLAMIKKKVDIFLSHDWPLGVYKHGDWKKLIMKKKHFTKEVKENSLGNPESAKLLECLKPRFWFSGHLHCRFEAQVPHSDPCTSSSTYFLALDKCLPGRCFFEIIDIDTEFEKLDNKNFSTVENNTKKIKCEEREVDIQLDTEWLSILSKTNHIMNLTQKSNQLNFSDFTSILKEFDFQLIKKSFDNNLILKKNLFCHTAPIMRIDDEKNVSWTEDNLLLINPQTEWFCSKLDLVNPFKQFLLNPPIGKEFYVKNIESIGNPDEINLEDEEVEDFERGKSHIETFSKFESNKIEENKNYLHNANISQNLTKTNEPQSNGSLCKKLKRRNLSIYDDQ